MATSLEDAARAAADRAFAKPADPTPQEQFDAICRAVGVPTLAEEFAGWQERALRELLALDGGGMSLVPALNPDPRLMALRFVSRGEST
ncbi:hypothetical protein [Nocardia aurea]|uniref:hypothetical protein n=1 Tax=Nocardia aurea TaxID=2144174 RepID=UPI0033A1B13B